MQFKFCINKRKYSLKVKTLSPDKSHLLYVNEENAMYCTFEDKI